MKDGKKLIEPQEQTLNTRKPEKLLDITRICPNFLLHTLKLHMLNVSVFLTLRKRNIWFLRQGFHDFPEPESTPFVCRFCERLKTLPWKWTKVLRVMAEGTGRDDRLRPFSSTVNKCVFPLSWDWEHHLSGTVELHGPQKAFPFHNRICLWCKHLLRSSLGSCWWCIKKENINRTLDPYEIRSFYCPSVRLMHAVH